MNANELAWRTPNGHEGRDLGDGCIGQGMPKIASKPPEARRKTGADFSSHTSEGSNTADTLTLNSWSADFETLNFQSLSHLACGTLFCQA